MRSDTSRTPSELAPGAEIDVLLPYVTDLQFEVDRLRRQSRFIEQQARDALKAMRSSCLNAAQSGNAAGALA